MLAGQVRAQFAKLARSLMNARGGDDSALRARLAEIGTDLDAMEMIDTLGAVDAADRRPIPARSSSLLKLRWSELRQSIAELAMDVIGERGAALASPSVRSTRRCSCRPEDEEVLTATVPRYLNYARLHHSSAAHRKSRPTSREVAGGIIIPGCRNTLSLP